MLKTHTQFLRVEMSLLKQEAEGHMKKKTAKNQLQ